MFDSLQGGCVIVTKQHVCVVPHTSTYIAPFYTHKGPKICTHFHRGYLQKFLKLNVNVMYGVYCNIVSKYVNKDLNCMMKFSVGLPY